MFSCHSWFFLIGKSSYLFVGSKSSYLTQWPLCPGVLACGPKMIKFQTWAWPFNALKNSNKILKSILKLTGNQWRAARIGVMWSLLLVRVKILSSAFSISCSFWMFRSLEEIKAWMTFSRSKEKRKRKKKGILIIIGVKEAVCNIQKMLVNTDNCGQLQSASCCSHSIGTSQHRPKQWRDTHRTERDRQTSCWYLAF